jgi:hypothetical protein
MLPGWPTQEDEMDGTCSMNWWYGRLLQNLVGQSEGRRPCGKCYVLDPITFDSRLEQTSTSVFIFPLSSHKRSSDSYSYGHGELKIVLMSLIFWSSNIKNRNTNCCFLWCVSSTKHLCWKFHCTVNAKIRGSSYCLYSTSFLISAANRLWAKLKLPYYFIFILIWTGSIERGGGAGIV